MKTSTGALPQKVASVEGITEYRLANGLKVLLFPDPSKQTITVNITYLVGSRLEGYGETGMAHLLEHLLFKGSKNHPNVAQELTDHGSNSNGTTWYDRTNYYETFTATDQNLNWALSLESDRMINSFIAKKDLQSEFSVVRNEFESGENYPSGILMERVMSAAYLWHNYGKSTIGSKEDIERVPIENLQAFYKKYYQPDNAVLMITGKIDEAKTLLLVSKYFGAIPRPSRKLQEAYTAEPVQDGERYVTLRRVGDVQTVSSGYHIPAGTSPEFASIDILNEVLTGEPSGRFYKALIEPQKASSEWGYAMALRDPGFVYFSVDVLKEKSLDEAKKALLGVLDSLNEKPVTAEEVERARNKLLKDFELFYRNSEQIGLAMSEYMAEGDWRMAFIYRDRLKAATVDDVNKAAKAYFKPDNRTVGQFIPDKNPNRAEIPAAPDVAALVKDYKGQPALAAAEAFDASPANIDKRTKKGEIAGGAKWAVLSKTTRGSSVNVQLQLRIGDENSLQNKTEIAQLTALMLRRGTASKTRQQLNDELDKLQSQVNIYGRGQIVNISIQSTKDNLNKVLVLVNDMLHHPSFPQQEFTALIQENLSNIDQQKSDPASIAFTESDRLLNPYPKNHISYTKTFDEQTEAYKALKLDDLKNFYTDFYNSTHATVAVVGDCNEAATIQQLDTMLHDWKSKQDYTRIKDKKFDVAGTDKKINTPDKKNAFYVIGLNLPVRDDQADYPALNLGNFILGGGFLNSRLATRVRQKEGLSYGIGSYNSASAYDTSGFIGMYAIYNPDNLAKLEQAVKEEFARILKDGITADELKAAKAGYLESRRVARSEDGNLVGQLNNYLPLNRTLNFDAQQDKAIENLTLVQVNEALHKYVQPEKFVVVKAGDFDKTTTSGSGAKKAF
ncbi:MAG: insulinase family protein [Williamsia sp.]|nr:insulinase family protein [Williamsia sp.]